MGKLVIIDLLLRGNNLDQYAQHLSLQDRQTARLLLQNQQSALSQRLLQAVEAAYAIRSEPTPGTLDSCLRHVGVALPIVVPDPGPATSRGCEPRGSTGALARSGAVAPVPEAPQVRAGDQARQGPETGAGSLPAGSPHPEGRVFVEDKAIRQKLRNICNPLELGQMSETHFVLGSFWKNHFNRLLAASDQPHPTAADLRRWMDQPEERGLPREIQNLLILVYADQTNRSFVRFGGNYTPSLDDLPNELELQEQTLPDLRDWEECVTRVADIMGHAISRLLNASNLASLAAKVSETLREFRPDCDGLPDRLQLVLQEPGRGGGRSCPGGSGQDGEGGEGAARRLRWQGADQAGRGDRSCQAWKPTASRWDAA